VTTSRSRRGARVLATAAAALLLAGCATSAQAQLDQAVADVTDQANVRNAEGLRTAADELQELVSGLSGSGDLGRAKATRLLDLASKIRADADLLEREEQTPTPAPTTAAPTTTRPPTVPPTTAPVLTTASPTPSRTASPTPSPTPTPSQTTTPPPTTSSPTPTGSASSSAGDEDEPDEDEPDEDEDEGSGRGRG